MYVTLWIVMPFDSCKSIACQHVMHMERWEIRSQTQTKQLGLAKTILGFLY